MSQYVTISQAIQDASRKWWNNTPDILDIEEIFTNAAAPFIPYLENAFGKLLYRFDAKEYGGFMYAFTKKDNRLCLKVSDREDGDMDVTFGYDNKMIVNFFDGQLHQYLKTEGDQDIMVPIDEVLLKSFKTTLLDPTEIDNDEEICKNKYNNI